MQRSAKLRSKQDKTARIKIPRETRATKTKSLTVASVLKTISDPISVELFKSISEAGSDSSDLRSKTRLSRRQYYSRLFNFTRNGILMKKNGKNYRTTFGRVVYHTLITIENAVTNYYKLKAIDSIGLDHDIPQEERKKMIDTLITDPDIRQTLFSLKITCNEE
ncbi:MAG: hypothetical protein WAM14_22285 [Candidatus Nitrosopolaris sp.]